METDYQTRDVRGPGRPRKESPTLVIPAEIAQLPMGIGRVLPHVCPKCGKAQQPIVLKTLTDKGYYEVKCTSCAGIYHHHPAVNRITQG